MRLPAPYDVTQLTAVSFAECRVTTLQAEKKSPTSLDEIADIVPNKCTFINPNSPWTHSIYSINKVQVSYFGELSQSNSPDYTNSQTLGLFADLSQLPQHFQASRKVLTLSVIVIERRLPLSLVKGHESTMCDIGWMSLHSLISLSVITGCCRGLSCSETVHPWPLESENWEVVV